MRNRGLKIATVIMTLTVWTAAWGQSQESTSQPTVQKELPDAPAPADPRGHFTIYCKQPDPPPPAANQDAANAPSGAASQPAAAEDQVNLIDSTPQMPLLQISDFGETGGKDKLDVDSFTGHTIYFQDGSTANQLTTVATLGVCDNVDVSVQASGVCVRNADGTRTCSSGDFNIFFKGQYWADDGNTHRKASYAAFEISFNGATQHSQDAGIGDPWTVNFANQYSRELGENKHGTIWWNTTQQVTLSTNKQVTPNNTAIATSIGVPITKNIAVSGEVGFGHDFGSYSQGGHQLFASGGLLGKLTKCTKWMAMVQTRKDFQPGGPPSTSTTFYLGIRKAWDIKTGECGL